jgi:phosphatidyl-myo-inositol alpha-mannosyltransferase
MKVLHLINGDFYSGAERVQDLLALNLPAFGYEADFAALKRGRFAECRRATGSRLFDMPMRSRTDLAVAWRIARLMQAENYGLLHTHTTRSAMIGALAARLAQRPFVHHVHSPAARDTQTGWRNTANSAVERWTLRGARRLIAVSESLRRYLELTGVPASQISVVPNGVPVCSRHVDWSPPTGRWTLGTVGLFRPRKGIEILIEALHLLVQRGIDAHLRAIGSFEEDSYRVAIEQLAERLGVSQRIQWTGFTTDVDSELRRIDVFVLPSLYGEGLPMALIEAMALGLPVVATAVEGTPEVLTPAGAGLLVEPGNAPDLAAAVASLIELGEDARTVAEAGRQRQMERYADAVMAKNVARVYDDALLHS